MPLPLNLQQDSINCQVAGDFFRLQKSRANLLFNLTPMYRYLSLRMYNTI